MSEGNIHCPIKDIIIHSTGGGIRVKPGGQARLAATCFESGGIADLAKAGTYHLLVQKRITAIADIRNNAAHGHPERFTAKEVEDMISYIEGFLADYL